jgi:uncharacterized damage-inducible protein DinB
MHDYFRTLARYNALGQHRLYKACLKLSEADYRAPRGAFFGSIHGTLNHILVADRIWLARLGGGEAGIARLAPSPRRPRDPVEARQAQDAALIAAVEDLAPARFGGTSNTAR